MRDTEMLKADFIHLHVHSHYSLLNALPTPKELVRRAQECNMPALALTDNGALYGAINFYKECTKGNIKPIIGIDAYLAPRTRFDKDSALDRPRGRVVLLAKNNNGYKNLIKIVTESYVHGFYYHPRVDHDLMKELSSDLVCIIPSFSGEPVLALKDGRYESSEATLDWYKGVFAENCYLEVTHHNEIDGHEEHQKNIMLLAEKTNTPLVAAHDVYYLKQSDYLARETMVKIQTGGVVETQDTEGELAPNFSFISQERALELFTTDAEKVALKNSVKIASECTVEMSLGSTWYFPDYQIESGRKPDEELDVTASAGVAWRGLSLEDPEVKERLEYELGIIKMKGYAKYFLVVGDLLREARKRKILTTIRGSVAGSLTTYVLGITNVNPLKYKLPFERFLNPERPSAPDIDMDYADNRRDEIIEYARTKYGTDNVAQIGTFGTMMARAAVRDVARALGHPYSTGDRIAKLIPIGSQGFPMTIEKALEIEPDLLELYKKDPDTTEVIDLARQIEGRVRHVGVHAAGVVIAPEPLTSFVPVQPDPKTGKLITQYDMHSVGEDGVGLLKFDFLGIKNLSILAEAVRRVRVIHGIEIDIEEVPIDDTQTYEMLARGETMGLFQLNGTGMTSFLKQLKPTNIHDINAMVALYRPGPMESIPQYIERKHNPTLISYVDPRLEKILDRSYGVVTYQDDVLMIARELAGYSWLEADMLRKAMGKKIPKVMEAEKEKLTTGFVNHGKLSKSLAEKLWKLIEPFAAYGFNKCLSADTRIIDSQTGIPTTIATLLKKNKDPHVYTLNNTSKLVRTRTNTPFRNGTKQLFKLVTRSGREIRATDNHPFKTFNGWAPLRSLRTGTRIAVPRHIPEPKHTRSFAHHEAVALGYLLAEGNLCHPHGIYFYSTRDDEVRDFIEATLQFRNAKITIDRSKKTTSVYVGQSVPSGGNTLRAWLKQLGLVNKKAVDKHVPENMFSADNETLALFLGKLWQGDGAVSVQNMQTFYATSSKALSKDVQHILLRLGITSTRHTKLFRYRGGHKIGWTIVITARENITRFRDTVGVHLIGTKKEELETLVQQSTKRKNHLGRGTADTIPAEILDDIRAEMNRRGVHIRELAQKAGIAQRLLSKDARKRGITRDSLFKIATALESRTLLAHATSDIFWDEVISIEPDGKEMTYDLSVPKFHNFVANDIIVHNSHAASYGKVAYQTAYMKANYPVEYMSAVLTADSGDTEKIAEIIHECTRMDIDVLPPDINESFSPFSVVPAREGENQSDARIRFGLTTIKNFGEGIAEHIIEERKAHGNFASVQDFLSRITSKNLNKKSLEALVMSGCFDRFLERGLLLANIETLLIYHKEHAHEKESAQDSLFGEDASSFAHTLTLSPAQEATKNEKLLWEKELLGVYVSGHPLDAYQKEIESRPRISALKKETRNGIPTVTAGIIESVRELLTKKGDKMAFVALSDGIDTIETVAFPEIYRTNQSLLTPGSCIAVQGKISMRNDESTIIIDRMKRLLTDDEKHPDEQAEKDAV